MSREPDYLSIGTGITASIELLEKNLTPFVGISYGHDDIGRTGMPKDYWRTSSPGLSPGRGGVMTRARLLLVFPLLVFPLLVLMIAAVAGCEGQIAEPGPAGLTPFRTGELLAPARAGYEQVADALQPRCGTLDCHGQWGRTLRLFGGRGLRLNAKENAAEGTTTPQDVDATYWSVIALEPERLSAVVAQRGQQPERLTLIRKARGTEKHAGGACMSPPDALDRCLASWFAAAIDTAACKMAADFTRPGAPPAN